MEKLNCPIFAKSIDGGAGYRSRYLSHAKRALYHLSYAPNCDAYRILLHIFGNFCWKRIALKSVLQMGGENHIIINQPFDHAMQTCA